MIKLSDGCIADMLPYSVASARQTQAFGFALQRQMELLCNYADNANTYASIAAMPEPVLDLMALELRTPAYDETYDIATKRDLIVGTLLFYMKMGTPSAVNQIMQAIFGSGNIEEWFDYDGEPHHFRAYIYNPSVENQDITAFRTALETVKRLSSWLDELIVEIPIACEPMRVTAILGRGMSSTTLPITRSPSTFAFAVYPAATLGKGHMSTTIPATPSPCALVGVARISAAAQTILQTTLPQTEVNL